MSYDKPLIGWTLTQWRDAYADRATTPASLLERLMAAQLFEDHAWIERLTPERLARALRHLDTALAAAGGDRDKLPLYGVPFAAKDNIDAAGWPTTAACEAFAYLPDADATVVARLRKAGAVLIGKTNLDQFATGLVGTRSPYGRVPNTFNPEYISGGSSSGSASVAARGLAAFTLGTDTAGSGRVPAGLNNIVGLKPTRGWLSTTGLVPACRTLDCISVFALTVEDAIAVADIAGGFDETDAYSRRMPVDEGPVAPDAPLRLAVPAVTEFFGDAIAQAAFEQALSTWQSLGASLVPIDFAPFSELAALLYSGPWVAERYLAVATTLAKTPDALDPVVRVIVESAANYSAADAFKAEYRRAELARVIQRRIADCDALVVPTAPTHYKFEQIAAEPVLLNARLGTYTNFTNLADLSALALPGPFRTDGMPAGITLIGPAWADHRLAALGRRWQHRLKLPLGATGQPFSGSAASAGSSIATTSDASIALAVVGAHLSGMPLNHQLTSRGAVLIEACRTSAQYRLYALANTTPPKPGLVRVREGAPIELELWSLTPAAFASFVEEVPSPMGVGTVELSDGRRVKGFICEPIALEGARDITEFGGWRAYLSSLAQ